MYALRTALRAPTAIRATRSFVATPARWKDAWANQPDMNFSEFNKHVKQPNDVSTACIRQPSYPDLSLGYPGKRRGGVGWQEAEEVRSY